MRDNLAQLPRWSDHMKLETICQRGHLEFLAPASGRAQGDLRAQRRLMVQGRLGGWLLRASVSSLCTAPFAR